MTIHIELQHVGEMEGISQSIAFCGASALLSAEGNMMPPDYDFFIPGSGEEHTTCPLCEKLRENIVMQFAIKILHGNQEHRNWLLESAKCFISKKPLPKG